MGCTAGGTCSLVGGCVQPTPAAETPAHKAQAKGLGKAAQQEGAGCRLFAESPARVFPWLPDAEGLRSSSGNFPPAHAWQIKEPATGAEGGGSLSISPHQKRDNGPGDG